MKKLICLLVILFVVGCSGYDLKVETAIGFAKTVFKHREVIIMKNTALDKSQKKSILLPLYQSQGLSDKEIEKRWALIDKFGTDAEGQEK
jgi:hypothetical protein